MSKLEEHIGELITAQTRESTKQTYSAALELFRKFYQPQGTIKDFLLAVEIDYKQTSFFEQKRVAMCSSNLSLHAQFTIHQCLNRMYSEVEKLHISLSTRLVESQREN